MLPKINFKELIIGMEHNTNIFMVEIKEHIVNGIVGYLIIQNIRYKDFYYLILDSGLKSIMLMVIDLMELLLSCISTMELVLDLLVIIINTLIVILMRMQLFI